jgi:hypothetical protein
MVIRVIADTSRRLAYLPPIIALLGPCAQGRFGGAPSSCGLLSCLSGAIIRQEGGHRRKSAGAICVTTSPRTLREEEST